MTDVLVQLIINAPRQGDKLSSFWYHRPVQVTRGFQASVQVVSDAPAVRCSVTKGCIDLLGQTSGGFAFVFMGGAFYGHQKLGRSATWPCSLVSDRSSSASKTNHVGLHHMKDFLAVVVMWDLYDKGSVCSLHWNLP